MMVDEYTLIKSFKNGKNGEVYLGVKAGSSTKFAISKREIKKMTEQTILKKYWNNELFIMKDINHPNIIKLIDIKQTSKYIYIITEYCNGGSLEEFLENYLKDNDKALPEEIVQYIMRQIIEAFRYLYNKKIMHRCIDLRHILIDYENEIDKKNNNIMKGKLKIINLENARYLKKGELSKSFLGIPLTMSPLILNQFNTNPKTKKCEIIGYNEKEDIWSLGIIFYKLLIGKNPFDANSFDELINKVNEGEYDIPITLSEEAISFLNSMLQYYPFNRLSADELYNHAFLRKSVNEFKKLNLDIIKNSVDNLKIKMNIRNEYLILKISGNLINKLLKQKSINFKNFLSTYFGIFKKNYTLISFTQSPLLIIDNIQMINLVLEILIHIS